jgi:hypothetical protein
MWVDSPEDYRPGSYLARLGEGGAPWEKELAAQAIGEAFGAGYGELVLESILWPDEAAQGTHNSASIFKTTSDVAGALRHAPAYSITFTHVTTSARMPATHIIPREDAYREGGECIINPTPGFKYRPPAQPVDITSSIMPNHAEDDDLLDRQGGQQYESGKEDSGFEDYSGDDTSDGRVSPETCEELPARKKLSKRKEKPRVSPADTGGRDADLVSAGTPMDPVAQISLSAESADAPVACLPQADESATSAGIPTDPVAQDGLSAKSADTPIACLPQANESTTSADTLTAVQAAPGDTPAPLEGMPGTPEEVTATAAHADQRMLQPWQTHQAAWQTHQAAWQTHQTM